MESAPVPAASASLFSSATGYIGAHPGLALGLLVVLTLLFLGTFAYYRGYLGWAGFSPDNGKKKSKDGAGKKDKAGTVENLASALGE